MPINEPIKIKVDGVEYSIDDEILVIGDLDSDMSRIASDMAFWAKVWAAAESERYHVDGYYRNWRAAQAKSIMESDPKLAEWKVKVAIESKDMFVDLKKGYGRAVYNATLAKGVFQALEKKANLLQSKGASARAEMSATGMHTKVSTSTPKTKKEQSRADRMAEMRKTNKKKKK